MIYMELNLYIHVNYTPKKTPKPAWQKSVKNFRQLPAGAGQGRLPSRRIIYRFQPRCASLAQGMPVRLRKSQSSKTIRTPRCVDKTSDCLTRQA
jgi:hypothetical protein